MNREIEFRGKRKDNGKWVYGVPKFIKLEESSDYKACIITGVDWDGTYGFLPPHNNCLIEVIPETVGQYSGVIGLIGNKGVRQKIFKCDIVKIYNQGRFEVVYSVSHFGLRKLNSDKTYFLETYAGEIDIEKPLVDYKIIGNIHDNKSLLDSNS